MLPIREERLIAQQNVDQERHPDLPANGVGAVAQEITELKRLLDLLEKDFNRPAAAVKVGYALRTPFQVVGQEDHLLIAPIDFDKRHDTSNRLGIFPPGGGGFEQDQLVAEDAPDRLLNQAFLDPVGEVVLAPCHPRHQSGAQIKEMFEINISLVEND